MRRFLPLCAVLFLALTACEAAPRIFFPDGGRAQGRTLDGGTLTWYRDVLPLAQRYCTNCHTAGGIGPFSMDSYDEAFKFHASMAEDVNIGKMPPWPAAAGCQSYRDSRRLAEWEADVFVGWSNQGAKAGNPADAPPEPESHAKELPWVSLSLEAEADYTPPAMLTDEYRCFTLDPGLTTDRDLIGFDIRPGRRNMVHHVLLYTAAKDVAQAKDDGEAGLGWTCFGSSGTPSPRILGVWAPGMPIIQYPQDTGITMKAGEVIAMQVHYNMANGVGPDRTVVNLQLADQPVAKKSNLTMLVNPTFLIPPNSEHFVSSLTFNLAAGSVWGVRAHMHTLGTSAKVTLNDSCLLDVPKWDFEWQLLYFFDSSLTVPSASKVRLTCEWANPSSRTVRFGESTSDEMCIAYLYWSP